MHILIYTTRCRYAALRNPRLGGAANHQKFVRQLRDGSVELNDSGEKMSDLKSRVFYHSDRVLFPTTSDIQGRVFDDSGKEVSIQDWVREKVQVIEDQKADLQLNPRCTHLIFWDTEGAVTKMAGCRPLEQPLPREQVEAFQTALREEGVAQGVVLINGDELDFDIAKQQVSQSNPVLVLKSVGGASDLLASIFDGCKAERARHRDFEVNKRVVHARKLEEKRLREMLGNRGCLGKRHLRQEAERWHIKAELEDDDAIEDVIGRLSSVHARKKFDGTDTVSGARADSARDDRLAHRFRRGEHLNSMFKPLDGHKGRFHFKPGPQATLEEMIAVDVAPCTPSQIDGGDAIQKQLAEMLAMQSDERELMRTELLADVANFDVVVTTYEMANSANMKTVLCHRRHVPRSNRT